MIQRVLLTLLLLIASGRKSSAVDPKSFYFEMARVPSAEFWVGRYEVTQAQYHEIMGENPSRFRGDNKPVDSVSWEDATDFCEKLTRREHATGRLPSEYVYNLPTDAQWDLFAVGTSLKEAATSLEAPRDETEAVGQHPANPLGLYDVVGNVWEWCRDWYGNTIRKLDANRDLPFIPSDAEAAANGPEEIYKVLRGGAWDTSAADGFTLSSRLRYAPGMGNSRTGFRCVVVRVGASSDGAGVGNSSPTVPPPPRH